MKRLCLLLASALASAPATARAHDAPAHRIEEIDFHLRASPGSPSLLLERASLLRRAGRFEQALADLARLLVVAPEDREALLELALTRADAGDETGALAALDACIGLGAAPRVALATRGLILEARGRLPEARADVQAALDVAFDPDMVLARGRIDEARGALDQAAQGYEEGLRALSGAATVRLALIRVERSRRRFDRALSLVEEALAGVPVRGEWLLLRARIHEEAGRPAQALADRREALEEADALLRRRPSELHRLTRARALLGLGQRAAARRAVQEILASAPSLRDAAELLQEIDRKGGRR